ncbi:HlyD family secretion protein [Azospirillum sp. CT11-132]|uniref:HlyD family secretion protein n=1 Tax=Azospirillum sp. CT11-132 TaxID=3396317 RepID=UPI0039A71270
MVELTHGKEAGAAPAALGTRKALKRMALALVLLGGVAAAGNVGYRYWTIGRHLESTDDAYVKADHTVIAPKVSGYVAEVLVQDNERVAAGQPLARIDDRDFRVALDQARADLETTEAAIRNLDAQIVLQRSLIEQEKADVAASEVALAFAQKENARYSNLMRTGYGTTQRAQQAESTLGQAQAKVNGDRAALAAAENKIAVLVTERGKAVAQRDRSRSALEQARLNLSYTVIAAPISGTVGARSLRVGQYVQTGTQLMAVVPLQAVYVVANFKETQLTHVHAGQPVEIAVDGFPGVELKGHVDSLSPASGLEFALLPPDNATGNFTKIVQRIPVRIVLDPGPLSGLLRPGMSVEPTIDTRETATPAS